MPTYTQANIEADVTDRTHGTVDATALDRIINRAILSVLNDVDLRSTKRKSTLSPNIFKEVYDYTAPSDLKGLAIIDIRKQTDREAEFELVSPEYFDRMKTSKSNICCLTDDDLVRKLRISADVEEDAITLHNMDSVSGNGTWSAGDDASNITLDSTNHLSGSGSLNFDTASGDTTAYIENSDFNSVDLTNYENHTIFAWIYVPDADVPTNFILRWGSNSSNYYSRTVTTNNEGAAFVVGWNLVRFPWDGSVSTTGTPTISAIDYMRLTITKDAGDDAATDWRVDNIVARTGHIHEAIYYSKYLWQSNTGTFLENSTASTDLINVDADEYNIILLRVEEYVNRYLDQMDNADSAYQRYYQSIESYGMNCPSERKHISEDYYEV